MESGEAQKPPQIIFMRSRNLFLFPMLLVFLCGTLFLFQQQIDAKRSAVYRTKGFHSLPSGFFLRVASLEYKEVMADIFWIQAIQLIGKKGSAKKPGVSDRIYDLLDRATDLHRKFLLAYQTGGIALSVLLDRPDLSNNLSKKGFKHIPDDWHLPFYIGFNYMYFDHNSIKAAFYMEKAARLSGSPPYLHLLVARLYSQGDDPQTAIFFLKSVYLTTKDEAMKEEIVEKILDLEKEISSRKELP